MFHFTLPTTPSPSPATVDPPPSKLFNSFRFKKWFILLIITIVVSFFDQWSKHWAQEDLQNRPRGRITVIANYFDFSYVRNPGAAWGFLAKAKESFRQPFFNIMSLFAFLFILYIHHRLEPHQWLMLVSISLVLGGAVGNSIDRFHYRYVVDFIELHYLQRYRWPTFNVADIAITLGVILLFGEMFKGPKSYQKSKDSLAEVPAESPSLKKGSPLAAPSDNNSKPSE